jgi:hypothetical protein
LLAAYWLDASFKEVQPLIYEMEANFYVCAHPVSTTGRTARICCTSCGFAASAAADWKMSGHWTAAA